MQKCPVFAIGQGDIIDHRLGLIIVEKRIEITHAAFEFDHIGIDRSKTFRMKKFIQQIDAFNGGADNGHYWPVAFSVPIRIHRTPPEHAKRTSCATERRISEDPRRISSLWALRLS